MRENKKLSLDVNTMSETLEQRFKDIVEDNLNHDHELVNRDYTNSINYIDDIDAWNLIGKHESFDSYRALWHSKFSDREFKDMEKVKQVLLMEQEFLNGIKERSNTLLFHGSRNLFSKFTLENHGMNGSAQGIGIYLSPSKDLAAMYAESQDRSGYVYSVTSPLENELSLEELTLDRTFVSNIVEDLQTNSDCDILSNFGEVAYEGASNVLHTALDALMENDSDIDLYNEIINITGAQKEVTAAFYTHGRYTHCIAKDQTIQKGTVVVILDPEKIQIQEVIQLENERTVKSDVSVEVSQESDGVITGAMLSGAHDYSVDLQIANTLGKDVDAADIPLDTPEERKTLSERISMAKSVSNNGSDTDEPVKGHKLENRDR